MFSRSRKNFNYTLLGVIWLLVILTFIILHSTIKVEYQFLSPVGEAQAIENYRLEVEKSQICDNPDCWVDQYATKYAKNPAEVNRIKVLLHFLLYKESMYGVNTNCGDGGKSCGPLQFHQSTWERMRNQMGEPIGDRYDMRLAIQTTAWAIATGHELEWGPCLRGEIQI